MSFKVGGKARNIATHNIYKVKYVRSYGKLVFEDQPGEWRMSAYELVEPVTPKVGDTIRATRGETVVVGRVTFHSSSFGTDILLDNKTSASVRGEYEIEIIKPKVVLPTGKFASIMVDAVLYTHFSKNWVTSAGSRYTDGEIIKMIENSTYGNNPDKFRVVFPGE